MSESMALVVEDDRDIALMFNITLQQAGFATEVCYDGQTALDRLAELTPRLIMLDLNLPRANGVDVLRHMRRDPRLEKVPVIVATANPQMADQVYDLAEIVLIKPISYEQLRDLILRFR